MSDLFDISRRRFLSTAALAGTAVTSTSRQLAMFSGMFSATLQQLACAPSSFIGQGSLPTLDGATGWLNSPRLTDASLRGKVVLVNFWTHTCINWIRALPHVRAWAERYGPHGLVVVGVHTPEFSFEHEADGVREACERFRVAYPVAMDNDYAIWRSFGNHYWPALYLSDHQGRIRHHHFGEGEYAKTERVIQQLLSAASARDVGSELATVEARGVEADADWKNLKSGENYLGTDRTTGFVSSLVSGDGRAAFQAPAKLRRNEWALSGAWTTRREAVRLNSEGGRIGCGFHARDVHLVMGPVAMGAPVRFRVRLNGQAPSGSQGVDIDSEGLGIVRSSRIHQLIRQQGAITDQQLEIEFLDAGVEAFAFTFG